MNHYFLQINAQIYVILNDWFLVLNGKKMSYSCHLHVKPLLVTNPSIDTRSSRHRSPFTYCVTSGTVEQRWRALTHFSAISLCLAQTIWDASQMFLIVGDYVVHLEFSKLLRLEMRQAIWKVLKSKWKMWVTIYILVTTLVQVFDM